MARIPYAAIDDPQIHDLVERIATERGDVLHLYRMLLHSPSIADGWRQLMTAIRTKTRLPGSLRELIIVRIGILNKAAYEIEQHVPIALREGVSQAQIDALDDWHRRRELFTVTQRLALDIADQMTLKIQVDEELWQSAKTHWNAAELVELIATVASYNMVSRFLVALSICSSDE